MSFGVDCGPGLESRVACKLKVICNDRKTYVLFHFGFAMKKSLQDFCFPLKTKNVNVILFGFFLLAEISLENTERNVGCSALSYHMWDFQV